MPNEFSKVFVLRREVGGGDFRNGLIKKIYGSQLGDLDYTQ